MDLWLGKFSLIDSNNKYNCGTLMGIEWIGWRDTLTSIVAILSLSIHLFLFTFKLLQQAASSVYTLLCMKCMDAAS